MNKHHYKKGDSFPIKPSNDGHLYLLSMRFCPFAHRIHLVLNAKQLQYHSIFINLQEKPKWLTQYSRLGKVPALGLTNEPEHQFLTESLLVADYLDEKYPTVQLHPVDPLAKFNDRLLVQRFEPIAGAFFRAAYYKIEDDKAITDLLQGFDDFESELSRRGTKYFGGAEPRMVDFMIWPWCERMTALKGVVAQEIADQYDMKAERFPKLLEWRTEMLDLPAVQQHYLPEVVHIEYYKEHQRTGAPDYDNLF